MITAITICLAILVLASIALIAWQIRRRHLDRWLGALVLQPLRTRRAQDGVTHVLLCIADHFEPHWGDPGDDVADDRAAAWANCYESALGAFRDSDGRAPRHTFFYPIDQYHEGCVERIAELCRRGFGELEIHLHHDRDSAENLARTLHRFTSLFAERHGALGRWPDGRAAYGFVHGNWALDNSRPDGRWCGVDDELSVLARTGCYADFTLPSAPSPTQTRMVNAIYRARGCPGCRKSHDRGVPVGRNRPRADTEGELMLIQGPLRLWWPHASRTPRIENGCIQAGQVPSMARLDEWIRAGVHVPQRPDWVFVKLHTHGAVEANRSVLLGPAMQRFHAALAERAQRVSSFRYHYVTAREMYNLARAAESGWQGSVADALDFEVAAPVEAPLARVRNSPE